MQLIISNLRRINVPSAMCAKNVGVAKNFGVCCWMICLLMHKDASVEGNKLDAVRKWTIFRISVLTFASKLFFVFFCVKRRQQIDVRTVNEVSQNNGSKMIKICFALPFSCMMKTIYVGIFSVTTTFFQFDMISI